MLVSIYLFVARRTFPPGTVTLNTSLCSASMGLLGMTLLNVVSAALLINSNKALLAKDFIPGQSAALTTLHYSFTFISLRATRRLVPRCNVKEYQNLKIFIITLVGSFGVVCSNVSLRLSSVSFHQMSRLLSLPGGLFCDYILYGRSRNIRELFAVFVLAYAVCQVVYGDLTFSWLGLVFSILSVGSMLGTKVAIKHVCEMYGLSSIEFSYMAAPFGVLSSIIWWAFWTLTEGFGEFTRSRGHLNTEWYGVLFLNCGLAVVINVTSTWCATHCSTLLYALLNQCKTLIAITVSTYFFDIQVSFRGWILLGVSFSALFCFAQAEALEMQEHADWLQKSRTKRLFLNSVLISNVAVAVFATFLKGPSISSSEKVNLQVHNKVTSARSQANGPRFSANWTTSSEALSSLRNIQSSATESYFHEATHVLYDLRSFLGNRPVKYLEIGSYTGVSASLMLTHPFQTSVTAVDPCVLNSAHFNGTSSQENTIKARLAKHAPRGCSLRSPWKLIVGFSPAALPRAETFDIIFIDGDHSTRGVWDDYLNTVGLLRPGGFMVFDDYLDYVSSAQVRGAVDGIAQRTHLTSIGVLKNVQNVHPKLNQTGINEYIFQSSGKFDYVPQNVPRDITPMLCITVATHRRKDGSSPSKLVKLWEGLENQTYTNWILYLTGDHYDDENEWKSLPFANDRRVKMFNFPEPGERGKLEKSQMWANAGLAAMNDAIRRLLHDGFEWAVHLDDDDHWDADHLQNIVAGIRTGATFVMTSSQHMRGFLPRGVSTPYLTHISHTVYPGPCRIPHSAVAYNVDLLKSRYEVTDMPADADLWSRIIFEDDFYPAYVPVISVHHADEGNHRGNALIVRKFSFEGINAPAGWSVDDSVRDYTALAASYFPERLSDYCMYVIGPRIAKHGFRELRDGQIPYFIHTIRLFENMAVWEKENR